MCHRVECREIALPGDAEDTVHAETPQQANELTCSGGHGGHIVTLFRTGHNTHRAKLTVLQFFGDAGI